jgi:hypothetical protein
MPETNRQKLHPVKDYWFSHGLQELSPEKFLKVVGKILTGEYVLLEFPGARFADSQSEERSFKPERIELNDGRMK